jgi:hypothetical protein
MTTQNIYSAQDEEVNVVLENPGSREAKKRGCTCPDVGNGHGRGNEWGSFTTDENCPLHGVRL